MSSSTITLTRDGLKMIQEADQLIAQCLEYDKRQSSTRFFPKRKQRQPRKPKTVKSNDVDDDVFNDDETFNQEMRKQRDGNNADHDDD